MTFQITDEPIDAEPVRAAVLGPDNGAVVVFHGTVRNQTADRRDRDRILAPLPVEVGHENLFERDVLGIARRVASG